MKRKFVKFEVDGAWHLVLDEPNLKNNEAVIIANAFQNAIYRDHPRALFLGKSLFGENFGEPFTKPFVDYNKNVKEMGTIQINRNGGYCNFMFKDVIEEKFDTVKNVFTVPI